MTFSFATQTRQRIAVAVLVSAIFCLMAFNPEGNIFFPKCPFLWLTGWKCPGCGAQRALHQLLNGHWAQAWQFNPLMVMGLPYVMLGIYLEWFGGKLRFPKLERALFGRAAVWIWLCITIGWFFLRNFYSL